LSTAATGVYVKSGTAEFSSYSVLAFYGGSIKASLFSNDNYNIYNIVSGSLTY